MPANETWPEELPVAITVTDSQGIILSMNAKARETFGSKGDETLVGRSVFACHPVAARAKAEALYAGKAPNHYTIRKKGLRKIIHQLPWYSKGEFAGFVEISIPIPDELPHFDRDAPRKP